MNRGTPHKLLAVCGVLLMLMQYVPVVQLLGGPRHHCPHCTGAYCPLKGKACKKQLGYCPHMQGMRHAGASHAHYPTHKERMQRPAGMPTESALACSCRNGARTPTAVLILDHAVVPMGVFPTPHVSNRPYGRCPVLGHTSHFYAELFRPPIQTA